MVKIIIIEIIFILQIVTAQNSPHGKINIPCDNCHTTESWKVDVSKIKFKHEKTGFKLLGQHSTLNCQSCHKKLVFAGTPENCSSCHGDFHKGTLGLKCQRCHNFNTWKIFNFTEKHNQTRFILRGAHRRIDCVKCHTSMSEFSTLPVDCIGCHRKDYETAQSPNHKLAQFDINCTTCHKVNSLSWKEAKFEHAIFKLEGKHKIIDCYKCHKGVFRGTPHECFACHQNDYTNAIQPNHKKAGMSTQCQDCHNTNAWRPSTFKHDRTGFKLTGAHVTLECSACHRGVFQGTPSDCWSCHKDNYVNTTDPNHQQLGFPKDCNQCHTTNGWKPATFDHNQTGFPLTGKHRQVNCSDCHQNGFAGTPSDCWSCHQNDYANTTDPNHQQLGFPKDCNQCHTTDGWRPATFDHNQTGFPLTGKHKQVNCSDCHQNGFAGTPKDCWSCHQSDYTSALVPLHTVGYPHECEMCHTPDGWKPSSFDHDAQYFRIYSGEHNYSKGKWSYCSDCHPSAPTSFTDFTCVDCHEHRKSKMDEEHSDVSGYVYESHKCYECHRNS